jgi:hypothetical protein
VLAPFIYSFLHHIFQRLCPVAHAPV